MISSMIDALNCKMAKRGFGPISVGIGLSWGRALMIKAGFKGSGINEVVYMGEVVNESAKLASWGNASWGDREVMVSDDFYGNLNDDNKKLFGEELDPKLLSRQCGEHPDGSMGHGGLLIDVRNRRVGRKDPGCDEGVQRR